jgi:hypothetical protein
MTIHEGHGTVDILALHDRARTRDRHERVASTAAGLVLTGAALFSGRWLTRALLGAAGTALIARGLSGLTMKQISTVVTDWLKPKPRADLERRFNDGEHDIVDAASFDSFPASDPPSYSPGAS